MITVVELRALLATYPDNAEVCIAAQPHCPFQYQIKGVISDAEVNAHRTHITSVNTVWIVEGMLIDAIPTEVWFAEFRKRCD